MAVQREGHPSSDVLKAFGWGKLDERSFRMVMDHLDQCDDCRKEVAALSGDDFLDRLRKAHGRNSSPEPTKSLDDGARVPRPPARQPPIRDLPPELAVNQHYEILRELGRGGMGVVYLAKNKLMDRLEVLKVVNKTLLDRPGAVERFLREIRSAAKLSHVNVVAAYHALQLGELLAFAMEYVEGQDLASLVKSQGPLPIAHACFYVQQAACGLQHAFEKHMVHRDIKPHNLILAREGRKHIVKVLDFGLAKATREKRDDLGLTGEGRMLGTPDYIAPEQSLDAARADIRADIYSLGCTLYYLLSGHPPFRASSLSEVLLAHHMEEAKPLNLVRAEVPEELASVVRKMMAKPPGKRHQTPLEVVQALGPFVKQGATPRSSLELSADAAEAKPAVKKAATADRPPIPAAEEAKKRPEQTADWEALSEGSIMSAEARRAVVRKRRPVAAKPPSKKKWRIGIGIGTGMLLLALLGMWAGGVFKVKTKDGTIVPENVPEDAAETGLLDTKPHLFLHFHEKADEFLKRPSMRFGLVAKDPKHPDQSKKLTFDEHGRSNNTVVRVDGKEYLFGEPPGEWEEMKGKLSGETEGRPRDGLASSWRLPRAKLKVTQEVEIVPGTQSRLLDTCLVRYVLENRDNHAHRVGIRFMLDTYIGANDGVPFTIPGASDLCDTKMEFKTADRVPDFIQALEKQDPRDPGTIAYLQFRIGANVESPERVLLGGWPNPDIGIEAARAQLTGWEVPFISMQEHIKVDKKKKKETHEAKDSAVTMYWNEQPLEPGKTRTVGFTYGLGSVDTTESGGHLLLTVGGRLVRHGEFTLTALVHDPQAGEKLTLKLPQGFSILKGEAEQKVPAVPRGASRPDSPVTWRLHAGDDGKYELLVRSSTGAKQKLPLTIRTRGVFD